MMRGRGAALADLRTHKGFPIGDLGQFFVRWLGALDDFRPWLVLAT